MTAASPTAVPADFDAIVRRIHEKAANYARYNFSRDRNDFLKAFFDLAQEFQPLEDFYRVCVAVPLVMTGLSCDLYIRKERGGPLELVCACDRGVLPEPEPAASPVRLSESPYAEGGLYVTPIFSRHLIKDEISIRNHAPEEGQPGGERHLLRGMFVVRGEAALDEAGRFFLGKYAGRIGYSLDNRLLAQSNVERLDFIRTLVMDIEHNVIVPNMYFRHLFKQLGKRIGALKEQRSRLEAMSGTEDCVVPCRELSGELRRIENALRDDYLEIVKHHAHLSLFIESLFRREHFEQGRLVLRPRSCFIEREVIIPQLDHYMARLAANDIVVDRPLNMDQEEVPLMVDIGLLAQVYANLFSNAAKYTREVTDHRGQKRKAVAYGRERVENFPTPGRRGIKFNVFTTGPALDPDKAARLFTEGARGENDLELPGTGHGLAFIRHVVEMHGGKVGYEATREGNNFYFILPLPDESRQG